MLDDLTHEQWIGWQNYFAQDPWDEKRKDDRSAVAALWGLKPYLENDSEMPGFDGPGYSSSKEDTTGESWARLQEMKRKYGQLNRKTSDPPND